MACIKEASGREPEAGKINHLTTNYKSKTKKKRLIPYGNILIFEHKRGCLPINDIWIYIGDKEGWENAKKRQQLGYKDFLLLPLLATPSDYDWPVYGYSILIRPHTILNIPQYREELAFVLLQEGATVVRVLLITSLAVYRRENNATS